MVKTKKTSRRQQILECLAKMLEASPGERITTAALAREVGVSEAALYRHFPSKSKMFEGLIEFIEESIFSRIKLILDAERNGLAQCEQIVASLLTFSEQNPGVTRLLTGDALTGETERLRLRIAHFFERVEAEFQQLLLEENETEKLFSAAIANLMVALINGRMAEFVRSEFRRLPTLYWKEQWELLAQGVERKGFSAENSSTAMA